VKELNDRIRTAVLLSCLLSGAAYAQEPIAYPELVAGPWELTNAAGIDGIFLRLGTHARGTRDEPVITSQSVSIGVYHRQSGDEAWGWYSPTESGAADAATVFDGRRLHIRNDRTGLLMDLTFDAGTHRWTGTWLRNGARDPVVLDRPHPPPGGPPSSFAGDWDGLPEFTGEDRRTRLHIAQSSDRALTIWMDRFMLLVDQRHGELLRLVSVDQNTIVLETTNGTGLRDRYQATRSADGSTLDGAWIGQPGSSRRFNASSRFRRMP